VRPAPKTKDKHPLTLEQIKGQHPTERHHCLNFGSGQHQKYRNSLTLENFIQNKLSTLASFLIGD
jgi:putative IMPACT (imprinted ancient) family translation regulator